MVGSQNREVGERERESGDDGRVRTIDAAINYISNACNRFRGCVKVARMAVWNKFWLRGLISDSRS